MALVHCSHVLVATSYIYSLLAVVAIFAPTLLVIDHQEYQRTS